MPRGDTGRSAQRLKLPMLLVASAAMLALPTAGLALVTLGGGEIQAKAGALDLFTPATVDPDLAARVASKAREKGIRFTPAGSNPALRSGGKTVTVAVRIDDDPAQAFSVRKITDQTPGLGTGIKGIATLKSARFDLGAARGYQSFARPVVLPDSVSRMNVPDLSEFEPSRPSTKDKPSRLQPRVSLEDEVVAGRSPNTLDSVAAQTVDVGGSFAISSKVDVTAGVRYSQERERLDPLTNSVQDSQAVYVGTQIKF
jgi:hypothetical protein